MFLLPITAAHRREQSVALDRYSREASRTMLRQTVVVPPYI
ncbi:hypothetical protein [Enterococcus phage vB_EfKS5]|nr:hypothetical protein [Enterococcus phage vB_EfKS5]